MTHRPYIDPRRIARAEGNHEWLEQIEARLRDSSSSVRGRHVTIGKPVERSNPYRDLVVYVILPFLVGCLICWVLP